MSWFQDEDQLAYGTRINHAAYRCRNIHEEDEKMTFIIDGLRPKTMNLVTRFRENKYGQDLTFERLIQFAKDEGDSFHAMARRLGTPRPSAGKPKPLAGIPVSYTHLTLPTILLV